MAEEKVLKRSCIIQKHDTEENWDKAIKFVPKKGQMVVYDPDAIHNYSRLKIGDGVTNVCALPFLNSSGGSFIQNIRDGSNINSLYQTSEKDDTALSFSFTALPKENLSRDSEGNIINPAGIYNKITQTGENALSLGTSIATGKRSIAIGSSNIAGRLGYTGSHAAIAVGEDNYAEGNASAAIGYANYAKGYYATAIGQFNQALGEASHAEGYGTITRGKYSHSEGCETEASGEGAHAEGYGTVAEHHFSHASGYYTRTSKNSQTVVGSYNSDDSSAMFIVGNGTSESDRRNVLVAKDNGRVTIGADPVDPMDVATKQYVDSHPGSGGGSSQIYIQDTEPSDAPIGAIWFDTSVPGIIDVKGVEF